ncbi:MAG: PepSY-associated TM helix domain-containing protein [Proteobacteria bacterium]|nr:PepSY-associated TM helix domain-containing protein [Pseudomonadota bacterium]MBU1738660.1 PepSY-associated TM helix domain-containing protein [Pseudomonadota bacterium]
MNWRRWNNIIHRDLGYLCFGLTIVYVISGIAVNHINIWNPSYRIEHLKSSIKPIPAGTPLSMNTVTGILAETGETGLYKNSFRPDPETLQIFVEGNTLTVNLASGEVLQEKVKARPILRQMNFLHLNHPKKLWSWFADLYALSLGLLAVTGLFVLKGKKGITGRGAWLTGTGILLPLLFLWLYY